MYCALQTGKEHGMITLDQSLKNLLMEGKIELEEAKKYAKDKESFR